MMALKCLAERQAGSRRNIDQISCEPATNMTPQTLQHRSTISEPAFSSELACATFQAQNSETSFKTNFYLSLKEHKQTNKQTKSSYHREQKHSSQAQNSQPQKKKKHSKSRIRCQPGTKALPKHLMQASDSLHAHE
jgi:hypothetical protein